jgi:hypothetical protein
VQAQLNHLAAQNWRPILMTAADAPAGITVFVILESLPPTAPNAMSEHDI